MLDSTTQNTAKKDALPNQTLQKKVFNMVDDIKAKVEKKCLGIVSCVDIVALAARDSVSFQVSKEKIGLCPFRAKNLAFYPLSQTN